MRESSHYKHILQPSPVLTSLLPWIFCPRGGLLYNVVCQTKYCRCFDRVYHTAYICVCGWMLPCMFWPVLYPSVPYQKQWKMTTYNLSWLKSLTNRQRKTVSKDTLTVKCNQSNVQWQWKAMKDRYIWDTCSERQHVHFVLAKVTDLLSTLSFTCAELLLRHTYKAHT